MADRFLRRSKGRGIGRRRREKRCRWRGRRRGWTTCCRSPVLSCFPPLTLFFSLRSSSHRSSYHLKVLVLALHSRCCCSGLVFLFSISILSTEASVWSRSRADLSILKLQASSSDGASDSQLLLDWNGVLCSEDSGCMMILVSSETVLISSTRSKRELTSWLSSSPSAFMGQIASLIISPAFSTAANCKKALSTRRCLVRA